MRLGITDITATPLDPCLRRKDDYCVDVMACPGAEATGPVFFFARRLACLGARGNKDNGCI